MLSPNKALVLRVVTFTEVEILSTKLTVVYQVNAQPKTSPKVSIDQFFYCIILKKYQER